MNYHDRTDNDWAIRLICTKYPNSENDEAMMCMEIAAIHGRDMDADIEEWG